MISIPASSDSLPSKSWIKMAVYPVSLLMILHKCHEYYDFADELNEICTMIQLQEAKENLSKGLIKSALSVIDQALKLLHLLEGVSPNVIQHIEEVGQVYSVVGASPSTALSEMLSIGNMVRRELEVRKFLLIPSPDDKKVRQAKPFGNAVYFAFPSARVELTNAGTAFAVELYTASVFHLMRATEIALRALCNDRGITSIKNAPVDMMQWETIIKALETETQQIVNWPNSLGKIKVQAEEFYNGATGHFRGIKDEWRNHVAHTRTDYLRSRAEEATFHVRHLTQTLATRISETSVTPKIWTTAELR